MSTGQASPPLAAGTRLDVYDIAGVLDQGRYSISYLARDGAGGEVLIKEFLPQEFAVREDGVVRAREVEDRTPLRFWLRSFLDKAVLLQKLNHPGLVRVLKQFEANGTGYYVCERVAGETLEAIVERQGVLSEAQLRRLLAPVLSGLEQAHAVGLLHRDIRPQNLLVRPDDSAVLGEFGVLRAPIRFKARTVFSAGTPPYAAPEEFFMAGPHGPWTDLYALGATAYRVVTGQAPPDARSRAGGPALPPVAMSARVRCSDALAAAIDEALRLPAEQRPQSVAAWRSALQGESEAAPEPDRLPPAMAVASPPRSRLPLLIGVAAVAAAAGGYFALRPPAASGTPGDGSQPARPSAQAALPAAANAAAPAAEAAPAQDGPSLDRLALDLMAKERKVAEARDQLQAQHDQALQQTRAAAPAAGRASAPASSAAAASAAAAPAPGDAELEAAEHLKQLQAEVEQLRKEKEAQSAPQVALASPALASRASSDPPVGWYRGATAAIQQSLRYPPKSLQSGEEGDILVRLKLRRDGSIAKAELQQRSAYDDLNREALEVFSRIRHFAPLPADYQPGNAEVDLSMPINFKLSD